MSPSGVLELHFWSFCREFLGGCDFEVFKLRRHLQNMWLNMKLARLRSCLSPSRSLSGREIGTKTRRLESYELL